MIEIETKDMNPKRANLFCQRKAKVHISKSNGTFYNGIIAEIGSDFFFIDDEKTGRQLIFFLELDKPIEEFKEEIK